MSNNDKKDHLRGSGCHDIPFMGYVRGGNRFVEPSKSNSIGFVIGNCMGNLTAASRNCNAAIVPGPLFESLRSNISGQVIQGRVFSIVHHLTGYKMGFGCFDDVSKSQENPCRNLVDAVNRYRGTSYFIHAVIVSSCFFQSLLCIRIHSNKWNYINCQIE